MKIIITILFAGIFTNNIITSNLLGIDELSRCSNKAYKTLFKNCIGLTLILILSTAVTYPISKWVLAPLKSGYLSPLVSLVIIFALLFGVYFLSEKYAPKLFNLLPKESKISNYIPIILGLCLLNIGSDIISNYFLALLYSVITGLGFTVVTVIFVSVYKRLYESEISDTIKGLPLTLIIAALISLAFGGFAGI